MRLAASSMDSSLAVRHASGMGLVMLHLEYPFSLLLSDLRLP